jgi:hypothetical protein
VSIYFGPAVKAKDAIVRNRGQALAFALVFGLVGTLLFSFSHADTPTVPLESEAGGVSSCAAKVTDATASGSSAVKFGDGTDCSDPTNLDASGNTIPDTDYLAGTCDVTSSSSCANTIFMSPSGVDTNAGTKVAPVKTINKAINLVPSGGTIVMRAGDYRDFYNNGSGSYSINTKSFTLQAYPHEQAWFDGADVEAAGNWTSDGNGHWYMAWNTPSFCDGNYYQLPYNAQDTSASNSGPCTHADNYGNTEANYPAAGDPQMVFVNGARMAEVDSLSGATGGKFFYDWSNKRIYISTDPSSSTVELAARADALVLGAPNVTIRGVGFKRFASNEYDNLTVSAVYAGGSGGDTFENDTFTQMAGDGLFIASPNGATVNSIISAYNGFDGMGSNGHGAGSSTVDNLVIENSVFNHNDVEMYGLNCTISCAASGVKTAHMNGYTMKNNIFENGQADADGAWCDTSCVNGVFVNNLVKGNGTDGYAYEIDDQGIIASNLFLNNGTGVDVGSTNVKIYNNTFVNNSLISIRIYDDNRSEVTSNIDVTNNITYGTSVNDNWFAEESGAQSGPSTFITGFDYNSYWRPSSFTLYRWIDSADNSYNSTANFRSAHSGFESHAQDNVGGSDPYFTDSANGDYSVRSSSVAHASGGPIPSDVAAALGITTAAGQDRGAFTWPGKP